MALLILLLGISAIKKTPTDIFPEIDIPVVTVVWQYPFAAVKWQAVLGNESFVQKVRDRIKGLHKERREITALRQGARKIDPNEVLKKVARKHQLSVKRLVAPGERGLHARNLATWMIWETGEKSLREIGGLCKSDAA
jgi:hypothetical protein